MTHERSAPVSPVAPATATPSSVRTRVGTWRTGLAASIVAGAHLLWTGARWLNSALVFDSPFQFLPGAVLLAAFGGAVAVLLRRPTAAITGALATVGGALVLGAAAKGYAEVEPLLDAVIRSKPFALISIATVVDGLTWGTVALIRHLSSAGRESTRGSVQRANDPER